MKILKATIPLLIFIGTYFIYANSRVIHSTDSMWALPTAISVTRDGNFYLGEYRELIKAKRFYGIKRRKRKPYNLFPYGTSLLIALPVKALDSQPWLIKYLVPGAKEKIGDKPPDILLARQQTERALASFIVSLTVVLWFFIARAYLSIPLSALLSLGFAFGTPAWSTASRGLWQHGPIMSLFSLSLFLLIYGGKRISTTGIPLAFGYLVRPTTALVWGLNFCYLAIKRRSSLILYLIYSALIILIFLLLNKSIYGRWIPFYYKPGRIAYHPDFFQAVLANFFSPNRGLIFQSPFLLGAFFTLPLLWRENSERLLVWLSFSSIGAHLIATSLFPNWWHGHSFGSRYMADILPFFFLLTVFFVRDYKHLGIRAFFILLILLSIPIHYIGATNRYVFGWNATPVNIDEKPERVWSLRDWQVLR